MLRLARAIEPCRQASSKSTATDKAAASQPPQTSHQQANRHRQAISKPTTTDKPSASQQPRAVLQ
eukprot:1161090-Pelagomonas_calceolata.AAC.7